jgi:hypothetical protein
MHPVSPVVGKRNYEAVETVYAKDQPEYQPLPSLRLPDGKVLTRWKASWQERLRILFTGNVYLTMLTFNKKLQPVMVDTKPDEEFLGDAWESAGAREARE